MIEFYINALNEKYSSDNRLLVSMDLENNEYDIKKFHTQEKMLEAFVEMGERLINIENCLTNTTSEPNN